VTEVPTVVRVHLDDGVWWGEADKLPGFSDKLPGFSVAADHLPDLIIRARETLAEVVGTDVEIYVHVDHVEAAAREMRRVEQYRFLAETGVDPDEEDDVEVVLERLRRIHQERPASA
jgi:hypothetical protein